MKKIILFSVVLFVSPWIVTHAAVNTLPNGNLVEIVQNTGVWQKLTLPSGLIFFAEVAKADDFPPILIKIAQCESGFRQFDDRGRVIRGLVNRHDIGKWQINETHWGDTAEQLGYDIYTEAGNAGMALYIYENYGTDPWRASRRCWNK